MFDHWQILATVASVIAAAAFVGWRVVRLWRGRPGGCAKGECGGCGGTEKRELVELDATLDKS